MNKVAGYENSLLGGYMRHQSAIRRKPLAGMSMITVSEELRRHGTLELKGDAGLTWDLLTPERTVLKSGPAQSEGRQMLDVRDLAPGKYLLRVGRDTPAAARFAPAQTKKLSFRVGPAF